MWEAVISWNYTGHVSYSRDTEFTYNFIYICDLSQHLTSEEALNPYGCCLQLYIPAYFFSRCMCLLLLLPLIRVLRVVSSLLKIPYDCTVPEPYVRAPRR